MDIAALYKLSYGLYTAGVKTPRGYGGCIIDAVAQVSAGAQPIIAVGSMKNNYTNECIKAEQEFTLSVLAEGTDPFIIANFGFQSARVADKWTNAPHTVRDGLPVLDGAVSYLRLRLFEKKELATHTLFLCDVTDAWLGDNERRPLIYGDYLRDMKDAAMEAFKRYKASIQEDPAAIR
ncbi:MAG: flavin reductase family protein [Clostridiales Family XIII bacterium]|jgi:flavin reductase (DIM6/NTAB) family NADH-FMN oxidoreductase RutF|nr:flavin reductase family protein [Clostridiales Family XIII bacterium]